VLRLEGVRSLADDFGVVVVVVMSSVGVSTCANKPPTIGISIQHIISSLGLGIVDDGPSYFSITSALKLFD